MATKKSTAVATTASEASLAELRNMFPTDPSFTAAMFPRFGMVSQDKTEKVGKTINLIAEAGTFFTEKQTEEIDEVTGKKAWERTDLGTEAEGIIVYQRKQLRYYDEGTEEYTSSPIYDTDDEIIPLWRNKAEIDRGTAKELQSRKEYAGVSRAGKFKSKLEENRVLYVLLDGEMHQLNLRGSSMYSFLSYARTVNPSTVLTRFTSEAKESGSISWNQMAFVALRTLTEEEAQVALTHAREIREGIEASKQRFAQAEKSELDKEFEDTDLPQLEG